MNTDSSEAARDPVVSAEPGPRFLAALVLPWVSAALDACEQRRYGDAADGGALEALRERWRLLLATQGGARSPLGRLGAQFSLSTDDLAILALAASPYLDVRFRDRCRELQRSVVADRCTVALAVETLFPDAQLTGLERFDPVGADGAPRDGLGRAAVSHRAGCWSDNWNGAWPWEQGRAAARPSWTRGPVRRPGPGAARGRCRE